MAAFAAVAISGIAGCGEATAEDDVVILAPRPGDTVRPGEPLTVSIAISARLQPSTLFVHSSSLGAVSLDVPSGSTALTGTLIVPKKANGPSVICVTAWRDHMPVAQSEVSVQVTPRAKLKGVRIEPDPIFLFIGSHDSYRADVVGAYGDGVERCIPAPTPELQFASLDPTIVTIDKTGHVTAVSAGTGTIQAKYDGHVAVATVHVKVDP